MTLKAMQIRQMIALDYTLFPLTFNEIIASLEKIGFDLAPSIPTPLPYGRFTGAGQVGRKGKTACVINSSDKSMQMVSDSLESTTDEMEEFLATILDSFQVDLSKRVKYYEYQSTYEYKSKKNAVKLINSKFVTPLDNDISDIFKIKIKPVVVRLGLENEFPNQIEWFDIKIRPDFQRNDGYLIEIIYRTEDKEKYQRFIANSKINIEEVIKKIEE